jgi:hypothetical protein
MNLPKVCWNVEPDGVTVVDGSGKLVARAADATTAKSIVWLPVLVAHFVHHTQQDSAHRQVAQALKRGTLKKEPCRVCGAHPAEAHHADYSKPLEVQWLCSPHHRAEHSKVRRTTPK